MLSGKNGMRTRNWKIYVAQKPEHQRRVIDEAEYTSSVNDGTDSTLKSQKKKRDARDDDDGELDSEDPSSSKKPRVVWSVELHQQFVNAVNQLGIDSMTFSPLNCFIIAYTCKLCPFCRRAHE